MHYYDLEHYHPTIYTCIPCESHGKVIRKNNHRARISGLFGRWRTNFTSILDFDNMYMWLVAMCGAPY